MNRFFKYCINYFAVAKKKKYCCQVCGGNYSYLAGLREHQKYICGKSPQFKCPYCDHMAKLKQNLNKHIVHKHYDLFTVS